MESNYPVQSAIQILKKMEDLGLGTLREISHPHNSKKSKLFVKLGSKTLAMMRVPFCFRLLYFQGRF